MASTIILSDNGASSGSAGLKSTAGNDGVLILQTTTSGGTATNALTLSATQTATFAGAATIRTSTGGVLNLDSTTTSTTNTIGSYANSGAAFADLNYSGAQHIWLVSGSEKMRIDSSGNVGIGTSSPAQRLDVQAPTAISKLTSTSGTNACFYWANNTGGNFYLGIDNSAGGSFGIAYGRVLYSDGAYPLAFFTNGAERARIDSSGSLQVGTTSANSARLSVFGGTGSLSTGVAVQNGGGVGNYFIQFFNSSGSGVGSISQNGASTTAYNTSSDYRLKEDIAPMTGALARIAALKPVTYKWKVDGSDGEGFIAHELQEVVPDCVTGEKDAVDADGNPQYQGIDTSFLVATLTAAIQEQQALINNLTERLAALEGAK